jgi:hypothetical protein
MKRLHLTAAALMLLPALLHGAASEDDGGLWFSERFLGTSNAAGLVLKANSTVGYAFNGHVQIYGGLPVYFTRAASSNTTTGTTSTTANTTTFVNGIGNAFTGLLISASNDSLKYTSDLMLTAPTGDRKNGFSTGHATADWTNTFSHPSSVVTPYGSVGLANTVSDTSFFVRPFTTNGAVAHFEGGALLKVADHVNLGASAYGVNATGQQEIFSKVLGKSSKSGSSTGTTTTGTSGSGNAHNNVFQTTQQTTTTADAANDHGFSTWLSLRPNSKADLQFGYSRSAAYQLNSVFFGVGFRSGH